MHIYVHRLVFARCCFCCCTSSVYQCVFCHFLTVCKACVHRDRALGWEVHLSQSAPLRRGSDVVPLASEEWYWCTIVCQLFTAGVTSPCRFSFICYAKTAKTVHVLQETNKQRTRERRDEVISKNKVKLDARRPDQMLCVRPLGFRKDGAFRTYDGGRDWSAQQISQKLILATTSGSYEVDRELLYALLMDFLIVDWTKGRWRANADKYLLIRSLRPLLM